MTLSLYDLNNEKAPKILVTHENDGLMCATDKVKLDGIENYTHPATHPATMITGLSIVATTGSYNDLDNKPIIPMTLPANGGNADTVDGKHATDFLSILGGTIEGSISLINGSISLTDNAVKLERISDSISLESKEQFALLASKRGSFITNNSYLEFDGLTFKHVKYDPAYSAGYLTVNKNGIFYSYAAIGEDIDNAGLYTIWHSGNMGHNSTLNADLLDGKHANEFANIIHTHEIESIVENDTHLFMTQIEKDKLNGISTGSNKTTSSTTNGNIKIDNVETIVYTHPNTHSATIIIEDSTHKFVTDAEKTIWNNKASTNIVTTSSDGLMSRADKYKLDNISSFANKTSASTTNGNIKIDNLETIVYTHPNNHLATMITEDSTHRFVTDAEKANWNGKLDKAFALATSSSAGLMSADDKIKLDGVLDYITNITRKSRCGGI